MEKSQNQFKTVGIWPTTVSSGPQPHLDLTELNILYPIEG